LEWENYHDVARSSSCQPFWNGSRLFELMLVTFGNLTAVPHKRDVQSFRTTLQLMGIRQHNLWCRIFSMIPRDRWSPQVLGVEQVLP
jgi:hypothetical protein